MKQEEKIKIRKGASNFTLVGNIRLNDNSFRIQENPQVVTFITESI